MVQKGDILYALYGATSGEIGISKIRGAINQAILAIKPNEAHDTQFIAQWLRLNKLNIIEKYLQGGQGNLSAAIVKDLYIDFPNKTEQTAIGNFFCTLDNAIALLKRKLVVLKKLKKTYLQQMFPQEGERVPKIRFAGFTGDWEVRKLGDVAESIEYGLNATAIDFDGINKYIRITDIDDDNREFKIETLKSPDYDLHSADNYKLQYGDILFARTGASVGKTYRYKQTDGLVYYAGFLIRVRVKREFDIDFIFQNTLTNNYNNFIKKTSQRSGQPGVNAQEYSIYEITTPKLLEQQKLGSFFKILDEQIYSQQQKIEKLKTVKTVYLQKMFI